MTREILFRGFHESKNGNEEIELDGRIIKGKLVYGFYWNNGVGNHFIKELYSNDEYQKITLEDYEVIPETVGQGTILKNGLKLFEGDIYHHGDPNITYTVVWHDNTLEGKQNGSSSYADLLERIKNNNYENTKD